MLNYRAKPKNGGPVWMHNFNGRLFVAARADGQWRVTALIMPYASAAK